MQMLDLDSTLWGGVLDDDGVDGIEVDGSYRGEAFKSFQYVLKQLRSHGVLLAAASKNDAGIVRTVLREHPHMVVREEDFVRVTASWQPKDASIRSLAGDLGLGLDAFVFVDDSPFECGLVRRATPEVAVVQLDDEPAMRAERLLAGGWFDVLELTTEDRDRTGSYRRELLRRDLRSAFSSVLKQPLAAPDYVRVLSRLPAPPPRKPAS